jgi:hypothetical protein
VEHTRTVDGLQKVLSVGLVLCHDGVRVRARVLVDKLARFLISTTIWKQSGLNTLMASLWSSTSSTRHCSGLDS